VQRLKHWLRFNWLYLGKPPWDTGISPPELLEFLEGRPPGHAIDLGCGTGTNVMTLAKAGWMATGVEFVPKAVALARRKLAKAGILAEVRAGDVSRLEVVQGCYDLALDIGCYHGLPDASRAAYRRNLEVILKPGGSFLIYAHLRDQATGGPGITQQDEDALCARLNRLWRRESQDRWGRTAVWMLFMHGEAG
jgi:SAM-dependent methyltransferase